MKMNVAVLALLGVTQAGLDIGDVARSVSRIHVHPPNIDVRDIERAASDFNRTLSYGGNDTPNADYDYYTTVSYENAKVKEAFRSASEAFGRSAAQIEDVGDDFERNVERNRDLQREYRNATIEAKRLVKSYGQKVQDTAEADIGYATRAVRATTRVAENEIKDDGSYEQTRFYQRIAQNNENRIERSIDKLGDELDDTVRPRND